MDRAEPHVKCVSRVCSRISSSLISAWASRLSSLPWELGFVRGKGLLWDPWASASSRKASSLSIFPMGQERENGSFDDFRSFMAPEYTDQFPVWLEQICARVLYFPGASITLCFCFCLSSGAFEDCHARRQTLTKSDTEIRRCRPWLREKLCFCSGCCRDRRAVFLGVAWDASASSVGCTPLGGSGAARG